MEEIDLSKDELSPQELEKAIEDFEEKVKQGGGKLIMEHWYLTQEFQGVRK